MQPTPAKTDLTSAILRFLALRDLIRASISAPSDFLCCAASRAFPVLISLTDLALRFFRRIRISAWRPNNYAGRSIRTRTGRE
jgi:hypothetical protein